MENTTIYNERLVKCPACLKFHWAKSKKFQGKTYLRALCGGKLIEWIINA